jgi:tetratricopeptide (TPR) repeat protein
MRVAIASVLLAIAIALVLRAAEPEAATAATPAVTQMAEVAARDRAIAFYRARAGRDPQGALDWAQLAGLYLQRARETGSHDDLHAAEDAARLSLSRLRARNGRSAVTLANALMGQHRFAEAAAVAAELVRCEPDVASYRALEAEIALERGDDATAKAAFATLAGDGTSDLAVAPRWARWLQMQGRDAEAYRCLQAALAVAKLRRNDLPLEQLAWFHWRTGEAALRCGLLREADDLFRAGLSLEPADARLYVARARLAARRGDWPAAGDFAARALELRTDTAALTVAYAAAYTSGDCDQARDLDRRLRACVSSHEGVDRHYVGFLLDFALDPAAALALAEADVAERRDPQAWHLLARALLANQRPQAAREAMLQAMRWGARDADYQRTIADIEAALGHAATSRAWRDLAAVELTTARGRPNGR